MFFPINPQPVAGVPTSPRTTRHRHRGKDGGRGGDERRTTRSLRRGICERRAERMVKCDGATGVSTPRRTSPSAAYAAQKRADGETWQAKTKPPSAAPPRTSPGANRARYRITAQAGKRTAAPQAMHDEARAGRLDIVSARRRHGQCQARLRRGVSAARVPRTAFSQAPSPSPRL